MQRVRSGSHWYVHHGNVRRRLAFIGLLVLLTSKTASIHDITLSIDAVDSALMGSVNKERLLHGLVDNYLSCGSFNGQLRPELDKY